MDAIGFYLTSVVMLVVLGCALMAEIEPRSRKRRRKSRREQR